MANNGIIIARSVTGTNVSISFECISNSSQTDVGDIRGPNGELTNDSTWTILKDRPGVIVVQVRGDFNASDQGIYTCTIPDANGDNITIDVGLYQNESKSECIHYLCITNCS